jgi:uncharacterized membrane protein YkvA (DUF1232 family)
MANKEIAVYDREKLARDEAFVKRRFWRKLRRTLGRIPFTEELLAAYYCATDGATPAYVKAVLLGAIGYFIVPTDLLPDFIAGFGFTDDATVLYAAISTVRSHIKPAHTDRAREALEKEEAETTSGPHTSSGSA